jgi:hypothetical protein
MQITAVATATLGLAKDHVTGEEGGRIGGSVHPCMSYLPVDRLGRRRVKKEEGGTETRAAATVAAVKRCSRSIMPLFFCSSDIH